MQLSFRLGVIFILLAAAALGTVRRCRPVFYFNFMSRRSLAYRGKTDHCRRGLFRLSAVPRREYLGSAAG